MNRARPTFQKRERERAKRERQQQKLQRRADAKARKAAGGETADWDIAHIVPGPQPPQED